MLLFALACTPAPAPPAYTTPSLGDVDLSFDVELEQVDAEAALLDAVDAALADPGELYDPAAMPAGARMEVDETQVDPATAPPGTQLNKAQATWLVALAQTNTAAFVAVPSAAIAICLDGAVSEIGDNAWAATNTVSDGVRSVTGLYTVAWVEVGWLAELRLWTSDGAYTGQVWLRGFVSADQGLGFWQAYDSAGSPTGVVEWLGDGAGNGEIGLGTIQYGAMGSTLVWLFGEAADGVWYHERPREDDAWVNLAADLSGEVRHWDYNGGAPACWDAGGNDVPCE